MEKLFQICPPALSRATSECPPPPLPSHLKVNTCFQARLATNTKDFFIPLLSSTCDPSVSRTDRGTFMRKEPRFLPIRTLAMTTRGDSDRVRSAGPVSPPTLTNVEEQDGPDWERQSSQVALRVGTPLEANHQQEAEYHRAHLRAERAKIDTSLSNQVYY